MSRMTKIVFCLNKNLQLNIVNFRHIYIKIDIMLKNYFIDITKKAVNEAVKDNKLSNMTDVDITKLELVCDTPKNKEFGDFAINISSLARFAKMSPAQIAQIICEYIKEQNFSINIVAGFINFKLNDEFLDKIIKEILLKKENYLKSDLGHGEKVNIEYVSANPTGPFHIGHGRWAALGSALANIMKYCNYDVFQEFYINDAGNQIQKLAKSLEIRVRQLQGEKIEMEEGLYPGEYLIDCARRYLEDNKGLSYADFAKNDMLRPVRKVWYTF